MSHHTGFLPHQSRKAKAFSIYATTTQIPEGQDDLYAARRCPQSRCKVPGVGRTGPRADLYMCHLVNELTHDSDGLFSQQRHKVMV